METQRSTNWLTAQQIWERALARLIQTLPEQHYRQWLAQTQGIEIRSGALHVAVSDTYARETLKQTYYSAISRAVQEVAGRRMNIEFQIRQMPDEADPGAALQVTAEALASSQDQPAQQPANPARHARPTLRRTHTFDEFVIGEANRLAANAALSAAQTPGGHNNPLFIFSSSGQGKTHLLQAIAHVTLEQGLYVLYSSAERFIQEYLAMVHGPQRMSREFAEKYETADIFIIDDIQMLAQKTSTQDGFFHVMDRIFDRGGQLVFSADQPPWRLHGFTQRLMTRFEGGTVVEIHPPDLELGIAILQREAQRKQLILTDDAAQLTAEQAGAHVRALLGALNRMRIEASGAATNQRLITVDLAMRVLLNYQTEQPARQPITIAELIGVACTVCEVPLQLITSSRRDKRTARARQLVMYLAREHTQMSYAEIASHLGRKDHTTVMYGCRQIEAQLKATDNADEWAAETRRLHREICKRLRLTP